MCIWLNRCFLQALADFNAEYLRRRADRRRTLREVGVFVLICAGLVVWAWTQK